MAIHGLAGMGGPLPIGMTRMGEESALLVPYAPIFISSLEPLPPCGCGPDRVKSSSVFQLFDEVNNLDHFDPKSIRIQVSSLDEPSLRDRASSRSCKSTTASLRDAFPAS